MRSINKSYKNKTNKKDFNKIKLKNKISTK